MNLLIIEPFGVKVNKSDQPIFPTNKPKLWESLQLNHRFLAQVIQYVAQRGYSCALERVQHREMHVPHG
jgi:hypothetical protein